MQNRTKVIVAVFAVVSLYGASVFQDWRAEQKAEAIAQQQEAARAGQASVEAEAANARAAKAEQMRPQFLSILERVRKETGHTKHFGPWGEGSGIFFPIQFWESLTLEEKSFIEEYAEADGYTGIVVGRQRPDKEIFFDKTVWPQS